MVFSEPSTRYFRMPGCRAVVNLFRHLVQSGFSPRPHSIPRACWKRACVSPCSMRGDQLAKWLARPQIASDDAIWFTSR
jgi:hypothetical protein